MVRTWKVDFTNKENTETLGFLKIEAVSLEEARAKALAYETIIAPEDWTFAHVGLDTVINLGYGLEGMYS